MKNVIDEMKLMLFQAAPNKATRPPFQGFAPPQGIATHQLGTPAVNNVRTILDPGINQSCDSMPLRTNAHHFLSRMT